MKNKVFVLLLALVLLLTLTSLVSGAQNLLLPDWWTVDGGSGTSQGGDYVLTGTAGQPEAAHRMSGGDFNLLSGFWGDSASIVSTGGAIYLPLVSR
jgi:hypothetical protein